MKNCLWSWSLVGLFVASSVFAADPVVILRDDGTYILQPNATSLVKVTVVDQRTGGTPNPPPNPPPGSTVTAQVEQLANAVNNKSEAALVGAIYALFARETKAGTIKPVDARTAIVKGRNVGLAGTNGVERWKPFGENVDGLMSGVQDSRLSEFFGQVRDGCAKSAGVDPGVFDKVSNANTGAAYSESNAAPAGFDWTMIFQIIMQIIQLLRDLGILG